MIGIYKITNKLNGKSYIGQSINIDRRWNQHKKEIGNPRSPLYIDFKKYGIENFNFEVLEKCLRTELDQKEIYWIDYYNTYNNGYNLTEGGQFNQKNIYKLFPEYQFFKGITTKQWQVYYYMLNISNFDKDTVENHRFLYKNKMNISQASKFLHISRPTIYKAIDNLKSCGLIEEQASKYLFYNYNWININKETLSVFINQTELNSEKTDLLRIYLILKKMDSIAECAEDKCFTKRDLILLLGHSDTRPEYYERVRDYIGLLVYYGLIEVKIHTEYDPQLGKYTIYHLQKVNNTSNNSEFFMNLDSEQAHTVLSQKMKEKLSFTQPGLLK